MVGAPSLVPEVGLELCLPRLHACFSRYHYWFLERISFARSSNLLASSTLPVSL